MNAQKKDKIIEALVEYLPPISSSVTNIIEEIFQIPEYIKNQEDIDVKEKLLPHFNEILPKLKKLESIVSLEEAQNSEDDLLIVYYDCIKLILTGLHSILEAFRVDNDDKKFTDKFLKGFDDLYKGANKISTVVDIIIEEL